MEEWTVAGNYAKKSDTSTNSCPKIWNMFTLHYYSNLVDRWRASDDAAFWKTNEWRRWGSESYNGYWATIGVGNETNVYNIAPVSVTVLNKRECQNLELSLAGNLESGGRKRMLVHPYPPLFGEQGESKVKRCDLNLHLALCDRCPLLGNCYLLRNVYEIIIQYFFEVLFPFPFSIVEKKEEVFFHCVCFYLLYLIQNSF